MKGKTVLITGATGGLGERLASAFYAAGANLILHGRNGESLKILAEKLPPASSQRILYFNCDIQKPEFIAQLKDNIECASGIDIVINNAAEQGPVGKSWEINPALWASTIEVDLIVPVAICQLAVPFMIKRGGGKIINISGGGAAGSRPGYSAYAVAKTGLVRFTECLADEAKEYGIDVNAVAPGVMPTRMHPERSPSMPDDPFTEPVALCMYLATTQSNGISGKLISAVWDNWRHLHESKPDKELYTLRRTVPL